MLELLLKLVVLLLSVPIPLVDLLQFEASVLGKLLQLGLGRFALRIFIALLQFVNLVARLPGSLQAHQSRSIFRLLFI